MKKHEKFILLSTFYSELRQAKVFELEYEKTTDRGNRKMSLSFQKEHEGMADMLSLLVQKFYGANPESPDAQEMKREFKKVRDLAEADAGCDTWTTEGTLWKMFEGDCLDDDEDWPPEWTKKEEAAWESYREEDETE